MVPAFAKLFMGDFERKALQNYPDNPHLWLRYIDDILRADVCKYRPEVGKIKFLKNPPQNM